MMKSFENFQPKVLKKPDDGANGGGSGIKKINNYNPTLISSIRIAATLLNGKKISTDEAKDRIKKELSANSRQELSLICDIKSEFLNNETATNLLNQIFDEKCADFKSRGVNIESLGYNENTRSRIITQNPIKLENIDQTTKITDATIKEISDFLNFHDEVKKEKFIGYWQEVKTHMDKFYNTGLSDDLTEKKEARTFFEKKTSGITKLSQINLQVDSMLRHANRQNANAEISQEQINKIINLKSIIQHLEVDLNPFKQAA